MYCRRCFLLVSKVQYTKDHGRYQYDNVREDHGKQHLLNRVSQHARCSDKIHEKKHWRKLVDAFNLDGAVYLWDESNRNERPSYVAKYVHCDSIVI